MIVGKPPPLGRVDFLKPPGSHGEGTVLQSSSPLFISFVLPLGTTRVSPVNTSVTGFFSNRIDNYPLPSSTRVPPVYPYVESVPTPSNNPPKSLET